MATPAEPTRRPRTKQLEERRLLKLLYMGTVLLLLVVLFATYRDLQGYRLATKGIRNANDVLRLTEAVTSSLKDAETGSRGYILTHDTVYLRPFREAQGAVSQALDELSRIAVLDTAVQPRMDTLSLFASALFKRIQDQILMERTSEPGVQGAEAVQLAECRALMDRIRQNQRRTTEAFSIRRDHWLEQEHSSQFSTPLMLLVYAGMAILATALLFWRLFNALGKAESAEAETARKVAQLDREVRTREFAERSLKRVLDSSPSGIMAFRSIRDQQGAIADFECILANREGERMVGREGQPLLGHRLLDLVPDFHGSEAFEAYVAVVEGGVPYTAERSSPLCPGLWLSLHAVRLLDGFVVTFTDISDRKRSREMLMESDRLATTGRIARAIAHEVRNPLTNLQMALEQLVDEVGTERAADVAPYTDILRRNTKRIGQLITDLLESSKPRELHVVPGDMRVVLAAALDAVSDRLALQRMTGVLHVADDLPPVDMDPSMIQLALVNICINAVEAMTPGEGRLRLSAVRSGNSVLVEVEDNGAGIAPENIQRLFEAFYSGRSGGMGLGLTTARTILNAHGVHVEVRSEQGQGTCFALTFPLGEPIRSGAV
ncbi:MAG: CHASE3 domain-containing protein [Flavobacteriales bacterium]